MSPVVRISDPTFERLQAIATPLVDTPASVIEKLLDFYESRSAAAPPRQSLKPKAPIASSPNQIRTFDPDRPPDLTHTRVLFAEFDAQAASGWNELMQAAHRGALNQLKSFDVVRSSTLSNIARGPRSDKGFHYVADIDMSIQNVEANLGWRNALHLARKLQVPIRVTFEWRQKVQASHPGEQGSLIWVPGNP